MCLRQRTTPLPTYPPAPPESGRDRVALMILTCLRSRLGRRPFQLRRVGGLVDSRARGPSTPTQGNMRAARLQTALKDTLCTVVVHDFHKVLGGGVGDSEFIVEEPQMCLGVLRCLHSEIFGTERPRNLLLICVGLSVASRNCGSQSLFTSLYSRMQRPLHYLAGGCYQSAR